MSVIEEYIKNQTELIELEYQEDVNEIESTIKHCSNYELQLKGAALLNLKIFERSIGNAGGFQISFFKGVSKDKKFPLPPTKLSNGDIIGIYTGGIASSEPICSGVIHKLRQNEVLVAFSDKDMQAFKESNPQEGDVHIVIVGSDVTKKRQLGAMSRLLKLSKESSSPYDRLLGVVFDKQPPEFAPDELEAAAEQDAVLDAESITDGPQEACVGQRFVSKLNLPQRRAVRRALAAKDLSMILGPPGTGKTTTVAEIIVQETRRGNRILACAPSNVAVDNLMERVIALGVTRVVRIGHPSRTEEALGKYTVDYIVSNGDHGKQVAAVRKELLQPGLPFQQRNELRKEVTKYERLAYEEMFERAQVVFATCTGADDWELKKFVDKYDERFMRGGGSPGFDLAIVDEAAQCLESLCWIPLMRARRCLLAGDDRQLPPTVKSDEAMRKGMAKTLFERLHEREDLGDRITTLLEVQYRMHANIMQWSNQVFYEGRLKAHSSVRDARIPEAPQQLALPPLRWIDSASLPFMMEDDVEAQQQKEDEERQRNGQTPPKKGGAVRALIGSLSKSNLGEVEVAKAYVKHLVEEQNVSPGSIGVISPYSRQVELLKLALDELADSLKWSDSPVVATIDSFQGRERDVIVLSLVRANRQGETGFLSDHRRLNVAVTRARRHACIIGDSRTISSDPVLKSLVSVCQSLDEEGCFDEAELYVSESQVPVRPTKEASVPAAEKTSKKERAPRKEARQPKLAKAPPATQTAGAEASPDAPRTREGIDFEAYMQEGEFPLSTRAFLRSLAQGQGHAFPCSLSALERKAVHSICEELKFKHESKGEGEERFIFAQRPGESKKPAAEKETQKTVPAPTVPSAPAKPTVSPPAVADFDSEASSDESDDDYAPIVAKQSAAPKVAPKATPKAKAKVEPKPKKGKGGGFILGGNSLNVDDEDDDLDSFLDEQKSCNKYCRKQGCKNNVELLGRQCRYCNQLFCGGHILPEIHGCGDAASKAAHSAFKAAGTAPLHRTENKGAGNSDWKHKYQHNQVKEAIAKAQEKRSGAPKAKKK